MSEGSSPDLSRIINIIMENPRLIEEISALAKASDEGGSASVSEPPREEVRAEPVAAQKSEPRVGTGRRGELLGALKPYLSPERAKAIDSMMTIAGILDAMKAR